jgi:hypothetical protein
MSGWQPAAKTLMRSLLRSEVLHCISQRRVLVKNAAGSYGVSYRWNDAQTEATLVADAGENFALNAIEGGVPRVQNYRIPSRAECLACHTPQAGHALSFDTRQLNRDATMNGFTGNQLALLHDAGYFSNTPDSPNLLPRHLRPDEPKSRSWSRR